MVRTRAKICGITSVRDARDAVLAGADAIGLNRYPRSARYVSVQQAVDIVAVVPAFVTTVGLFVNANVVEVRSFLDKVQIDLLQFHGDEDEAYCKQFDVPYMKVFKVNSGAELASKVRHFPSSQAILVDSMVQGQQGGTGMTFDCRWLPNLDQPLVLAGGLNKNNVSQAITTVQPYAVDVCSGVESEPGIKDSTKVKEFLAVVAAADRGRRYE